MSCEVVKTMPECLDFIQRWPLKCLGRKWFGRDFLSTGSFSLLNDHKHCLRTPVLTADVMGESWLGIPENAKANGEEKPQALSRTRL